MPNAKAPASRAPRGVDSDRRIVTCLMPDELAAFKARAMEEGRSLSNLARLLIVRAMAADGLQRTHAPAQRHTTSIAED